MTDATRQLSLIKGEHRYLFRYRPGNEPEVIESFARLAADSRTDFDWFDAAVLSYQMGKRIEKELDELRA